VRRLSFKTQFKIEFLGPFYGSKKSLKKTLKIIQGAYIACSLAVHHNQINEITVKNAVALKF
jgi:hypothetical protein